MHEQSSAFKTDRCDQICAGVPVATSFFASYAAPQSQALSVYIFCGTHLQ